MKVYILLTLLLLGLGATLNRCLPFVGSEARIERIRDERDDWARRAGQAADNATAQRTAFDESERLRGAETAEARTALAEAAGQCEARVASARKSAAAIAAIVTKEPRRDPQGCPVRQLVDPGQLRDALAPAR